MLHFHRTGEHLDSLIVNTVLIFSTETCSLAYMVDFFYFLDHPSGSHKVHCMFSVVQIPATFFTCVLPKVIRNKQVPVFMQSASVPPWDAQPVPLLDLDVLAIALLEPPWGYKIFKAPAVSSGIYIKNRDCLSQK